MIRKIIISLLFISNIYAITFEDAKKIEEEFGLIEALSSYRTLAKQNDVKALFRLAMVYSKNKPFEKNLTKTHDLLKKASKLNYHKATYYLGKLYLSKKSPFYDLTDAYNSFLLAANENYAPAQNMIGQFLLSGILVDKDFKMAVKYFERAAKQNYINAQCNLSFMYASGKGVFPNLGRAHQFAKEGKEKGNKRCIKVWKDYKLANYPEDKGWKIGDYNKPSK